MARNAQRRLLVFITLIWAVWAAWGMASGAEPVTLVAVDEEGAPVAGASVVGSGASLGDTDADGRLVVESDRLPAEVRFEASGFLPATVMAAPSADGMVRAYLRHRMLRGRILDPDGRPILGAQVTVDGRRTTTGPDGSYRVEGVDAGTVAVWRPAWHEVDFEWDGGPGEVTTLIEPFIVKAVHVGGEPAGNPTTWQAFVELAGKTELNGIMLDLKDEWGIIYYDSQVDTARRARSVYPTFNLSEIARQLHDAGVYLIGRIVTFQDPIAARRLPDMAVHNSATGGPFHNGGQYFLDPTDPDAREYGLELAEEACRLGVDEVQFDYVRYPDGSRENAVFDGGSTESARIGAIRSFLEEAKSRLHPLRCTVAGDVFGFITTATDDGGIGQQWEDVTDALDVVSPMLYPSHYGRGWFGYDNPNEYPADVVRRALEDGIDRLDSGAVIRPWLQDFGYTPSQVRAQIDSAEKFGLGWMLWNAFSEVSEPALRSAPR